MTNKVKLLSFILFAQFVLFVIFQGESSTKVFDKTQSLVSLNFDIVDKFVISSNEKEAVELNKKDDIWSLSKYFDFPADSKKIKDFFSEIKSIKQSLPAGKTLIGAKQFSVTKEKFEKKIDFYSSGKLLKTVYIGSSPSFKKVHMRVESENNTYVATFASYEYRAKEESWLDRESYKVSKNLIKNFQMGKIKLAFSEKSKSFVLEGLKLSEETNNAKASQIINSILNPSFRVVLAKGSYKTGEKVLSYKIETKKGEIISYDYYRASDLKEKAEAKDGETKESDGLVLKISNSPYYFEVFESVIKNFLELKREELVNAKDVLEEGKPSFKASSKKLVSQ